MLNNFKLFNINPDDNLRAVCTSLEHMKLSPFIYTHDRKMFLESNSYVNISATSKYINIVITKQIKGM
jgi:hypothetical protein